MLIETDWRTRLELHQYAAALEEPVACRAFRARQGNSPEKPKTQDVRLREAVDRLKNAVQVGRKRA
ncbi:hypothetical protein AKJ09_08997 [Labilithrix luteola]|uniref:Uncharacterized protein n=1 Tax=Labilithrix luteola TaxID=1391654 RepID=A0A0K1Q9C4_9BACT|nr:hypothetical protein AKJ09_08997 [Labilithrix luteola]